MKFSELSQEAKNHAYAPYVAAMDDDLNREDTVSIEQYEADADWDGLEFDENGEVIGFNELQGGADALLYATK